MQNIKALAYTIYTIKIPKYQWVPGYWYKAGRQWVDTSYYRTKISLVWVSGYWVRWGWFSWYVLGHYEIRYDRVKINRGYWRTTWKYKKGYWKKVGYIKQPINFSYRFVGWKKSIAGMAVFGSTIAITGGAVTGQWYATAGGILTLPKTVNDYLNTPEG